MRTQTRRLLAILVLVAASLLLAAPGVAGAHVKAKYRAEYRAEFTSLNNGFLAFALNYDNMKQASVDTAETMAAMVGDPNQHEQLVDHENWCLKIYNMNKGKPAKWASVYATVIKTFKGKAARYFATAAQQRTFKHACDQLKTYDDVLVEMANNRVYESFRLLGMDPPAIEAATATITEADEFAATGHEGWDKWLAALRALQ
jgi:hypothetical protein